MASDNVGFTGATISGDSDETADSSLTMMPGPMLPQPRVQKPGKSSMLGGAPTGA